jgi:NADPH-dependent 2,4-dienoyl-CoA reductase/sulfur reductase-like enzyme
MDEEFERIVPVEEPKKVLVIGGGPAGMEAARVAALRGHEVMLIEKEESLGGTLNIASVPPGKEKIRWLIEYYRSELSRLGVEVRLGVQVTRKIVDELQPDAIIVAIGCTCPQENIPGADRHNVVTARDMLSGKRTAANDSIVVIGGGLLGLETALFLASKENRVTVLKRYKTIAANLEPIYRDYILRELEEYNASILTEVSVERIDETAVQIKNTHGETRTLSADLVVLARDPLPLRDLQEELRGVEFRSIGDCVRPRLIIDAVREGYLAGKAI